MGGDIVKIYVASSWRNPRQPAVVEALRAAGHEVYDFRNPMPGNTGFGWRQCDPRPPSEWSVDDYRRVLETPRAQEGFALDMDALRSSDACVLVLPCGRSAHLELGWAVGAGKRTLVLCEKLDEPELMYLMSQGGANSICASLDELVAAVAAPRPTLPPGYHAELACTIQHARGLIHEGRDKMEVGAYLAEQASTLALSQHDLRCAIGYLLSAADSAGRQAVIRTRRENRVSIPVFDDTLPRALYWLAVAMRREIDQGRDVSDQIRVWVILRGALGLPSDEAAWRAAVAAVSPDDPRYVPGSDEHAAQAAPGGSDGAG